MRLRMIAEFGSFHKSFQQNERRDKSAMATSYSLTMSAGAYSWRYSLKCVCYHGLK